MKIKISMALSKDVLAQVDRLTGSKELRSAFIESVLRPDLRESNSADLHARDVARINRAAEQLNRAAADVLEYQADRNTQQRR
jgi:metal-responsive CopG/Arc/MetJ family transcriptional regulator